MCTISVVTIIVPFAVMKLDCWGCKNEIALLSLHLVLYLSASGSWGGIQDMWVVVFFFRFKTGPVTRSHRFKQVKLPEDEAGTSSLTGLGGMWHAWPAGGLPCAAEGFPLVPWAHLVPSIPPLRRKLRAALPCIGLSGISEGLWHVGWMGMEIIHAYDIDTELMPALFARFGPEVVERFNIGPSGNLLQVEMETWKMWT